MSVFAVGSCLLFQVEGARGRVVAATHQPEMGWINAGGVSANMVNYGFCVSESRSGVRNITDKQLVSQPVGLELPLVVSSVSLNNHAVSKSVSGANPVPASGGVVNLNAVSESFENWFWGSSSLFHGDTLSC